MWPNPDAPAASGVVSPVTTDPLSFAGAVTFSKDVTLDTTGSSSGAPRQILFTNLGAPSRSWRIAEKSLDTNIYNVIQGGYGERIEVGAYYGINLRGSAQTTVQAPATGATTDPGVSVLNTVAAVKALVVKGAASQLGNLFETQDSSGNPLVVVDSTGNLTMSKSTNILTLGTSGATLIGTPNEIDTGICSFVFNGGVFLNGSAPKWLKASLTQLTVGAAGAASALPASPKKYLQVIDTDGTLCVVPAFAAV